MSKLPENWGKDTSRNAWNKGNSTQPKKTNPFDKNTPKNAKEQVKSEVAPAKEQPAVTPKAAQPAKNIVTVAPSAKTEPKVEEKQRILPTTEKKNGGKKAIVVVAVVSVLIAVVAAVYFLFIRNNDGKDEISLSSAEESSAEEVQEESETFESREESEKSESSEESEMSEKNELTESGEESELSENSKDEESSDLSKEEESSSNTTEAFDINDYLGEWCYGELHTGYNYIQTYDYYQLMIEKANEDSVYFRFHKYEFDEDGLLNTRPLTDGCVTGRRVSESKATLDYYVPYGEDFVVINIEFTNNTVVLSLEGAVYYLGWDIEDPADVPEHMILHRSEEIEPPEGYFDEDSEGKNDQDSANKFNINSYLGRWVCGNSHIVGQNRLSTYVYDYEFNINGAVSSLIYFGISKYETSSFDEKGYRSSLTGSTVTGRRISENKAIFYFSISSGEEVVMNIEFANNTVIISLEGPAEKIGFDTNHLVFHRPDNTVS